MKATLLKILILLWCLGGLAHAEVQAHMTSQFLARGEQVFLEVLVDNTRANGIPAAPRVDGVSMEFFDMGQPRMQAGRRLQYRYLYVVSSYEIGQHTIPPFEVSVGSVRVKTNPVDFEVFDPNELQWQEIKADPAKGVDGFRYACMIKIPKRKIYQNQTFPAEIKIYVPENVANQVVDWGVPEFDREGLAVWRFEAENGRGLAGLLGQNFTTHSYSTTMTAIREGSVEIGPATVRLIYGKRVFRGFNDRVEIPVTLAVPKLRFEALSLPEGAPAGFDNAVGTFTLGTAIKETNVIEGEPIALDVVVSGRGNLDNLRTPKMSDSDGWKVYEATANQRGEERRNLDGSVVFSQFIRPLEMKSAIPSFELVYFDPDKESYETVTTEPIVLAMKPAVGGGVISSGVPQAAGQPVERMTDILGLLNRGVLLKGKSWKIPSWVLHAVAGAIALLLFTRILWTRYGHRLEKNPRKLALKKDLNELARTPSDDASQFLRAAGRFIEKWLPSRPDEDINGIMAERDRICFRGENKAEAIPRSRRNEILRSLRKAATGLAVIFVCLLGTSKAKAGTEAGVNERAMEAYDSAKYEDAAKIWLEAGPFENLSADTLYNIGNACFRMGSPGQAALYYRRALVQDPGHAEARQNLRFIERKHGSITVERPDYQDAIGKVPLSAWKNGFWAGAWCLIIGLLIFPATRPGSGWRIAGVAAFILSPLMLSVGALGWWYFPNDASFAPYKKQAVIVVGDAVLHTDAARTSAEVIDAPPGSLAEVLKRSGRWVYLGFASKTRGWVPESSIEMVIPNDTPEPPKLRKSDSDGSSA